jgi:hypothetical protein
MAQPAKGMRRSLGSLSDLERVSGVAGRVDAEIVLWRARNVSFRVTENVFPQSQSHKVAKAVRKNHHHHEQRPLLDK